MGTGRSLRGEVQMIGRAPASIRQASHVRTPDRHACGWSSGVRAGITTEVVPEPEWGPRCPLTWRASSGPVLFVVDTAEFERLAREQDEHLQPDRASVLAGEVPREAELDEHDALRAPGRDDEQRLAGGRASLVAPQSLSERGGQRGHRHARTGAP